MPYQNALLADNDEALSLLFIRPDGSLGKPELDTLFLPDMHHTIAGCETIEEDIFKTLNQAGMIEPLKSNRPG